MNSVHVVLCTYNGEQYLKEMLESLVSQTLKPRTVVVLDDCSTDGTCEIVESYKQKLPLEFIKNTMNSGHRAAFSKALEYTRQFVEPGDFIALADQDDIWHPEKNGILVSEIKNHALVFGDAEIIDKFGKISADSWREQALISTDTNINRQVAGINNVTGMLSLFKAELLDEILPIPEGVTVHDRWIAMVAEKSALSNAQGVCAIPQKVAQYRIHGNNAVGGTATPPMSKTLSIAKSWTQTILENKDRLHLNECEIKFAQTHLDWTQQRLNNATALKFLPWIIRNRNDLFLQTTFLARAKKIAFSCLGLSLAKKLFSKS